MIAPKLEDRNIPIEIEVNGQVYEIDYVSELKMSEATINDDLMRQPSLFAWYSQLEDLVESAAADARLNLDLVEAEADSAARAVFGVGEGKKVTEKQIAVAVINAPRVQEARLAYNDIQSKRARLKSIKEAFVHRKDMLVTLSANLRTENRNADMSAKELKS
jgi:hypothetical protein